MDHPFESNQPIYKQIRRIIEDQILTGQLAEGDQAPSTNQLVQFYKINHLTVSKGVNQLVEEGILFKKRGIGMFVAQGAREKVIRKRKKEFLDNYIYGLVREAELLGISEEEIMAFIKQVKGRGKNDDARGI